MVPRLYGLFSTLKSESRMNKFLSDILNFNQPINDITAKMLNEQCSGITLIQAVRLGNAIAKLGRVSHELSKEVYNISNGNVESIPYPRTK